MSATAGLTVVGTRNHMTYSGGQVLQIGVDGTAGMQHPVGTCVWCGQANVGLATHMDRGGGGRYLCLSSTLGPYIDPNQAALPANMKGAAGYLHR
jgi:hypothetical protein